MLQLAPLDLFPNRLFDETRQGFARFQQLLSRLAEFGRGANGREGGGFHM
jgi:hypothetical protein